MFNQLFFILWLFLPAGVANTVPVIAAKLPLLNKLSYPLDGYNHFRGQRILGDHKTVRGLIVGIFCSTIAVWLQQYLYVYLPFIRSLVEIDYTQINPIVLGFLLGLGALGGDCIKSFLKRQTNIPPGHSWFPFDQLDYIVGAIVLTYFYTPLNLWQYTLALVVFFILHVVISFWGYTMKLKKDPI